MFANGGVVHRQSISCLVLPVWGTTSICWYDILLLIVRICWMLILELFLQESQLHHYCWRRGGYLDSICPCSSKPSTARLINQKWRWGYGGGLKNVLVRCDDSLKHFLPHPLSQIVIYVGIVKLQCRSCLCRMSKQFDQQVRESTINPWQGQYVLCMTYNGDGVTLSVRFVGNDHSLPIIQVFVVCFSSSNMHIQQSGSQQSYFLSV